MRLDAVDAEQMPATSLNGERAELEHLYEMAPIALGLVDRKLRFVRVNERLAAINGRSIQEHIGRTIREVIPEIASQVEPLFRQVIDTAEPLLDVEVYGTTPSEPGAGKYWLASYYPLKSNRGTVWAVSVVVQDITERKLAELRLREEKQLSESVIESLPGKRLVETLEERLQFEKLLSELSARFVNLPAGEIESAIEAGLKSIVDFLDVDRGDLLHVPDRPGQLVSEAVYTRPGLHLPLVIDMAEVHWYVEKLRRGETVVLPSLPDDFPEEAVQERKLAVQFGVKTNVTIPIRIGGIVLGALSFFSVRGPRAWPDALVQQLRVMGEVFANALARATAETALRESEERFRLLADAAPVMVWMSGPDKACTYFNKGWLEFTGRPLERELGDGWAEGVHAHDFQRCLLTYARAFDARRDFQMEYRLRRHDGAYRWIWDIGVPRFEADGRFAGYIGSSIDITERKRAEEDLHKSEALNRAVLASLFAHVAIIDRDGTILGVNESWNRFASDNGADSSASVSAGANYLEVCRRAARDPEETARQALAGIGAVLAGSRERFALEYACKSPAEERWFEMTVEPLRRPEGGAVISHVNITKRKRAEAAVQQHRQELAHVTRVAAMGELAASLAHELNQPLTAILSNAQAACRLLAANPPDLEQVREILPDIVEDDKRAGEVIRRLRALLKKGEVQFKLLDLNHLIREVGQIAHSDAVAKKVGVTFDLDPALPPVRGDEVQLQQVVLNLMLNAFEAIREGAPNDGKLVIRTTWADAQTALVSVRDSGIGIAEDKLGRIFDTFYTTKPEGLGMGLAISRSIVEAHGGRIWAANNSDGGATFRFTLPVSAVASP